MEDLEEKIEAWNEMVRMNSSFGVVAMVDKFVQSLFVEIATLTAQLEGAREALARHHNFNLATNPHYIGSGFYKQSEAALQKTESKS